MKLFGLILRLLLAAVWFAAAAHKLIDLGQSARAVEAFQILPYSLAVMIGYVQPFIELGFGLLLLVGWHIRSIALASVIFNFIYILGIVAVAARGLRIDCGCFSPGGVLPAGVATQYGTDILRDLGFMMASLYLAWRPALWWALDNR